MNIFRNYNPTAFPAGLKFWLLTMKLTFILLFAFTLQISATLYSQQVKVDITAKEISVKDVLKILEAQSNYRFFYSDDFKVLDQLISVNLKQSPVESILDEIARQVKASYTVFENNVVVISPYALQNRKLTGRVTDESTREPLAGVNVVVEGTTLGVITDNNGKFNLEVPSDKVVIVFSYMGYHQQRISFSGQAKLDVVLIPDIKRLEEIVVVGYSSQTKSSLTTAVTAVKGNELVKQSTSDIRKALQGAVPGLTVIDQGGSPGNENVVFRIRGITSINSTKPLVIIDGVEQDINQADVNAIESISVLKDAASTAIYGSRGANGVILVTTKKGEAGKVNVTYNGFYGLSYPIAVPNPVDTRTYMELQNITYKNSGLPEPFTDIEGYLENMKRYPTLFPKAFPMWDEFFEWAPLTKHSLVVSGGSETMASMINVSFQDQDGVMPGRQARKYQLRSNNEIKLTKSVKAFANLSVLRNDWYEPNNMDIYYYQRLYGMGAFQNKAYPDGTYGFGNGKNIWADSNTDIMGKSSTVSDNATFILGTEVKFLKDFRYTFSFSLDAGRDINTANSPEYVLYDYWNESLVTSRRDLNDYSESRGESSRSTLNQLVTYQKSLADKHQINMLLGYSQDAYKATGISAAGQDFYNNVIRNLTQGDPANRNISNNHSEWGLRSYFGRAGYAFKQKYLFEMNARYDGSSRFPKGKKYTFFPSASVAWRISEEPFWQVLNDVVNSFKIRYSYGLTGNQSIGNYSYIPQLKVSDATVFYNPVTGEEEVVKGVGQTDLAGTNLSWETTYQHDWGIDMGLLNNKLSVIVDFYSKITDGILLDVPVAAVVGLNPSKTNAGIISNKGWEANLIWKDRIGDLNYTFGVNGSFVEDKLVDFGGLPRQTVNGDRYFRAKGTSLFALNGFICDGFYRDQADINNSPVLGSKSSIFPGDLKYRDISGPDGVPDGIISEEYDHANLGYGTPRYFFGSNITAEWKGIDIAMNWQGAAGHKQPTQPYSPGWPAYLPHYYKNYWTGPEDVNARYPVSRVKPSNNVKTSSFWLVSGDYLRLKSLTIGYTIPEQWSNYLKLSSVRLYVNGINLLTFSELYRKNEKDPEGNIDARNPENYQYYPQLKSFNGGIVVNF